MSNFPVISIERMPAYTELGRVRELRLLSRKSVESLSICSLSAKAVENLPLSFPSLMDADLNQQSDMLVVVT